MVYGVGDLVHTVIEENRIPSLLRKNGYLLTIYDKPYEPCSNRRLSTDRLCLFSFFRRFWSSLTSVFMVFSPIRTVYGFMPTVWLDPL